MREHCAQCLTVVDERLSYETPRGEILCGPCYFALWGPRDRVGRDGPAGRDGPDNPVGRRLASESQRRRPRSRRPKRGRPIWIPGPSGELDPRLRRWR